MTEEKNPYIDMPEDVFKTHLEQIKTVVTDKKVDVTQFFGSPITDEEKKKIEEVDALKTKVDELNETANAKELSETEKKLAQANIDRVINDIKKIDKDAPLEGVMKSKFNNLDKLDILNNTQKIVEHYNDQITTIRSEFTGDQGTSTTQKFSKPTTTETGKAIIEEMLPKTEK